MPLDWRHIHSAQIGATAREFARRVIAPEAERIDREDIYPTEVVQESARAGFNSMSLPEKWGGKSAGMADTLTVFEEFGYASAGISISFISIFQAQSIIRRFGTPNLQEAFLPRFADGMRTSYGLTEEHHGSDLRSIETEAIRVGEDWQISGAKAFISGGESADAFIILAKVGGAPTAFVMPNGLPGISTRQGAKSHTFGLRNGPHVDLILDDVRVPQHYMLGAGGDGIKCAVATLARSRVLAAGISLGTARAAIDTALDYAAGRIVEGGRVLDFQGIRWYFADLVTRLDAARLLVYQAARDLDADINVARISSEAKVLASRVAVEAADMAVQVCGAHGTSEISPCGRYLRDAKAYEIGGGSSEVLKNTIASRLIRELDRE